MWAAPVWPINRLLPAYTEMSDWCGGNDRCGEIIMSRLARILCEEADNLELQPGSEWRRGATRRLIADSVDIEIAGRARPLAARTIDVTPASLGVCCKERIAVDSILQVRRAAGALHEHCSGKVVHCTPTLAGYRIGIAIPGTAAR
jgi:hypothetical protein